MKDTKNKIALIFFVIALIFIIIGFAFAIFNYNKNGKDNIITLGNLELTLHEGETINLIDTYPITDSDALSNNGYSFTLENTGTVSVNYAIYLDDLAVEANEVRLDDMYLKYNLNKNNSNDNPLYLETLGTSPNRVIDQGTLDALESNEYVLRIWPTVDVDGDFGGHVWKGKLRITGDQVQ